MSSNGDTPSHLRFREFAPAIEFVCWAIVVLAPLLRLINGPAVTNDQFVIQVTLFSVALLSAIALRVYQLLRKRS
jgi:hypothetical protein